MNMCILLTSQDQVSDMRPPNYFVSVIAGHVKTVSASEKYVDDVTSSLTDWYRSHMTRGIMT